MALAVARKVVAIVRSFMVVGWFGFWCWVLGVDLGGVKERFGSSRVGGVRFAGSGIGVGGGGRICSDELSPDELIERFSSASAFSVFLKDLHSWAHPGY